jgi:V8-like Glu-specific endopeptidase
MRPLLFILAFTFSFQALAEIEVGDKELFGKYLRQQITDTSKAPYSFVGNINTNCTGTLIGPKHFITAGHCVYDVHYKQLTSYLVFSPRQIENGTYPFGQIKAKKIFIQKEFIDSLDIAYDFAVVELAEPIGNKTGWAEFQVITNETSLKKIRITGYPEDEIMDTMWSVTCPATINGTQIHYKCDTSSGMSGSSLFSSKASGGQETIYGIHSWGSSETNGGVIINQKNFDIITAWKNGVNLPANTVTKEF